MSEKVKGYIKELFREMNEEVADIATISPTSDTATQSIMEYVSTKIAAASEGYVVDLYSELSKKTLKEDLFMDSGNANRFYELNMRKKLSEAYQFDVQNLETYSTGVNFKEINRAYSTAVAAVGSAAVGGILLGALSGVVNIPMVVIIAGAVLAGIAGGGVTYAKIVPEKNKDAFIKAVKKFMIDLEIELINWVDEVIKFYNQQVEELKRSL